MHLGTAPLITVEEEEDIVVVVLEVLRQSVALAMPVEEEEEISVSAQEITVEEEVEGKSDVMALSEYPSLLAGWGKQGVRKV